MNQLALSLASGLAVVVSRERNLRMTLIGRDLFIIHRIHVLRILIIHVLLLPLSRLNHPCTLDFGLLSRARPPTSNTLTVSSITHPIVNIVATSYILIKVIASTRKGW